MPQYYVTEHHEAIIDPKVFDHVQAELLQRDMEAGRHSGASTRSQDREDLLIQFCESRLLRSGVLLPGLRVPDLQPINGPDDDDVFVEPRILAELGRDGHPALLVRHLIARRGRQHPLEVTHLADRRRSRRHLFGLLDEGGHRVDRQAVILPTRHHQPLAQFFPELRRQEETALFVELGCVGTEEHRRHPLAP